MGRGEGGGSPPENFLKTKKAGEAISGHFVGAILPSVKEEFQRVLLPFTLYKIYLCVDITVQI